jgi:di/tricarboxylate transporter
MTFPRKHARKAGLILGPVMFLVVLFFPTLIPEDLLSFEARIVLATIFWTASWWITEAIPVYVTAFPSSNLSNLKMLQMWHMSQN